ncbi:MAG: hypothetical protein L0Z62_49275 [Gemmataceae bacterium]|nr:hypothetical protein [Gemmataceae bacterium]
MHDPLQFIRRAVLADGVANEEHRWEDIEDAMWQLIAVPPTPEVEKVLLSLLRFEGQLHLTPSSEIPHSMSPEEMLKSLAIQALGKWTGLTYLLEMERVQATASSPVLSGIACAVIRESQQVKKPMGDLEGVVELRVGGKVIGYGLMKKPTGDLEGVAESSPEAPAQTVIRPLGQDRGMAFLADRRVRRRELQPVC